MASETQRCIIRVAHPLSPETLSVCLHQYVHMVGSSQHEGKASSKQIKCWLILKPLNKLSFRTRSCNFIYLSLGHQSPCLGQRCVLIKHTVLSRRYLPSIPLPFSQRKAGSGRTQAWSIRSTPTLKACRVVQGLSCDPSRTRVLSMLLLPHPRAKTPFLPFEVAGRHLTNYIAWSHLCHNGIVWLTGCSWLTWSDLLLNFLVCDLTFSSLVEAILNWETFNCIQETQAYEKYSHQEWIWFS